GSLIFEFGLELNGSRIISAASVEDRDRSALTEADIEPTVTRDRGIVRFGEVRRTEARTDDFSCGYCTWTGDKKTWRALLKKALFERGKVVETGVLHFR